MSLPIQMMPPYTVCISKTGLNNENENSHATIQVTKVNIGWFEVTVSSTYHYGACGFMAILLSPRQQY